MRQHLHTRGPSTNQGYRLVCRIEALVVCGSVHALAAEGMKTWNVRHSPVVEHTPRQNEDVGFIVYVLVCRSIVNAQHPLATFLIPHCVFNPVIKFDVLLQLVLCCNALQIIVYFFASSVVAGPLWVVLEQKCKAWGRNIASDT